MGGVCHNGGNDHHRVEHGGSIHPLGVEDVRKVVNGGNIHFHRVYSAAEVERPTLLGGLTRNIDHGGKFHLRIYRHANVIVCFPVT